MKSGRLRISAPSLSACLLFLLTLPSVALAAERPVWNLDGPAFSASAADLQKAAAAVPAEAFAEATVLLEGDWYTLDAAGRMVYRHHLIYRIETQAGVEDWAESSVRWEPWYQKQPEIHARVLQLDGKVVELDQKTLTDGPAGDAEEGTYTNARIRKGPLPALAVGVVVEEETVSSDKEPFFAAGGIYRDTFSRSVPVVREQLVVELPAATHLEYRTHLLPDLKVTDTREGEVRRLVFDQAYLPARIGSDIDLPTHQHLSPMVEFSTGASWAAVAEGYRKLAEPQIDPAKVKQLLPALGTDRMENIRRIVALLHKEVRYTGIEFDQASIQPATGPEVLKHHFGDCKDKAALLVAWLRAAGIPASMALLDTGPGMGITPELAGMNMFDHAIAYVPAATPGGAPLWIDATAEYAEVGTLPSMDQDRPALVIAEGTTGLVNTPALRPEENQLVELRDFQLAEYGGAHIVETSLTHGPIDQQYREDYGGADTRAKRTDLETYAKNNYLAKALANVERGDGKDLSKPFLLKLDMTAAKRGNTVVGDAAVAIPFAGIFSRLPQWFRTDPKEEGEELTPQQEENRKRAVAARTTEYDVLPFATEWRYTITPPAGFALRALPKDVQTSMGPALLTQHYESAANGTVKATLRFSTVQPHYTLEQTLALRDAVLAAYKQDMVLFTFDQQGAGLMAQGKMREALAADRALIEAHPEQAIHHVRMAYALLKASMGDRARKEAELATQLDPKSAVAFEALGWMCQHDAIGVLRTHGMDGKCADKAYRRAVELDPEDQNVVVDMAIAEEFDAEGERYTEGAHLADAIANYRAVQKKDKETGDRYEDNLLFDLLYNHEYKALLEELAKLPGSVTRDAIGIAATVAEEGGEKGIAAGMDKADHSTGGAERRSGALNAAGGQLLRLRLYPEAAEILTASVAGQANSAAITQQVTIFRKLKPWKGPEFPDTDPRGLTEKMLGAAMADAITPQLAAEMLSRHAYSSAREWDENLKKAQQSSSSLRLTALQSEFPLRVLVDAMMGNMKTTAEGDEQKGYRVSMQMPGAATQKLFLSQDDGRLRAVTDGTPISEAGNEVLYLLEQNRLDEAAALLDWMRDRIHKGGGDDPLSGSLFPRFWTVGTAHDPAAMRLAAAALVSYTAAVQPLIPAIRTAYSAAPAGEARTSLALLLAQACWIAQDGPALKPLGEELLKNNPDSYRAIEIAGDAALLLKDFKGWGQLLQTSLDKHPEDEQLLRQKANEEGYKGDFAAVRSTLQKVIDLGKGTANDSNLLAWSALFDGHTDAEVLKAAQQANLLSQQKSFATLHTLACIYAAQGKTVEASDLAQKAMAASQMLKPDSAVWFVYGMIYEQYGVNDAAIDAYRKVEKPEGPLSPFDTWLLTQARLKALGAVGK